MMLIKKAYGKTVNTLRILKAFHHLGNQHLFHLFEKCEGWNDDNLKRDSCVDWDIPLVCYLFSCWVTLYTVAKMATNWTIKSLYGRKRYCYTLSYASSVFYAFSSFELFCLSRYFWTFLSVSLKDHEDTLDWLSI